MHLCMQHIYHGHQVAMIYMLKYEVTVLICYAMNAVPFEQTFQSIMSCLWPHIGHIPEFRETALIPRGKHYRAPTTCLAFTHMLTETNHLEQGLKIVCIVLCMLCKIKPHAY